MSLWDWQYTVYLCEGVFRLAFAACATTKQLLSNTRTRTKHSDNNGQALQHRSHCLATQHRAFTVFFFARGSLDRLRRWWALGNEI